MKFELIRAICILIAVIMLLALPVYFIVYEPLNDLIANTISGPISGLAGAFVLFVLTFSFTLNILLSLSKFAHNWMDGIVMQFTAIKIHIDIWFRNRHLTTPLTYTSYLSKKINVILCENTRPLITHLTVDVFSYSGMDGRGKVTVNLKKELSKFEYASLTEVERVYHYIEKTLPYTKPPELHTLKKYIESRNSTACYSTLELALIAQEIISVWYLECEILDVKWRMVEIDTTTVYPLLYTPIDTVIDDYTFRSLKVDMAVVRDYFKKLETDNSNG